MPSLIFKELIFACPLPVQVSDKEVWVIVPPKQQLFLRTLLFAQLVRLLYGFTDILSSDKAKLCLYEDLQAMISVVRSGRNLAVRYLERTHGVSVYQLPGCARCSKLIILS